MRKANKSEKLARTGIIRIDIEEMTGNEDPGNDRLRVLALAALEKVLPLPIVLKGPMQGVWFDRIRAKRTSARSFRVDAAETDRRGVGMTVERKGTQGAIVITGASSGIGLACALHMDRLGFRVFAGIRSEKDHGALTEGSAGRITPLIVEVTDAASVSAAADLVARSVGAEGLRGLVNNAGIVVGGPLEFLPVEEVRKQFEVNVLGQMAVTQAFLPLLRMAGGRVVNMSSIAGRASFPYIGPYCASKYALEALTDALRMELLPWGIAVSAVEPGDVATPIWEKSLVAARKIAENYPSRCRDLYGPAMDAAIRASERAAAAGFPPALVARAVEHALTASNPKTRYVVGPGVGFRVFLKTVLPDRLFDRLVTRHIGISATRRDAARTS